MIEFTEGRIAEGLASLEAAIEDHAAIPRAITLLIDWHDALDDMLPEVAPSLRHDTQAYLQDLRDDLANLPLTDPVLLTRRQLSASGRLMSIRRRLLAINEARDPHCPTTALVCPNGHHVAPTYRLSEVRAAGDTLSFFCIQCGTRFPATSAQRHDLLQYLERVQANPDV